MRDPSDVLHLGGVTHIVHVSKAQAQPIITALMTCGHGHVFVVDQSHSPYTVRLGISEEAVACIGAGPAPECDNGR